MQNIFPHEVEELIKSGSKPSIIDVREAAEVARGKIPTAQNIPLSLLQFRLPEIDKNKEHIIVCHSGGRSAMATNFLASQGYKVKNMVGGMLGWNGEIE